MRVSFRWLGAQLVTSRLWCSRWERQFCRTPTSDQLTVPVTEQDRNMTTLESCSGYKNIFQWQLHSIKKNFFSKLKNDQTSPSHSYYERLLFFTHRTQFPPSSHFLDKNIKILKHKMTHISCQHPILS